MINTKRIVSIVMLICSISLLLSSCNLFKSDEQLINERLDSFLTAYNTGNMDGVLECLDAKTRNAYKSAMNITENIGGALINGFTGLDIGLNLSDLFGLGVGMFSSGDALTLNISDISVTGKTATVTTSMDTSLNVWGEEYSSSQKVSITLVKEGSDWYISGLS